MAKKEEPTGKKPDPKAKRFKLDEYNTIKDKLTKKNSETRLPLAVKLFIAFPILVLILFLCFGLFYIPHLMSLEDRESVDNNESH